MLPDDLTSANGERFALPLKTTARLQIRRQRMEFDAPAAYFLPSTECQTAESSADDSTVSSVSDSILLPTMDDLFDNAESEAPPSLAISFLRPKPTGFRG